MKLSVVTIIYNKEKEIPLVLKGFSSQQNVNFSWELIFVDDGSDDNTKNIIEAWSDSLPIKLIKISHSGNRQKARNTGIKSAQGKRIAIMDGDIVPRRTYLYEHANCPDSVVLIGSRLNTTECIYKPGYRQMIEKELYTIETFEGLADERAPHLWEYPLQEQKHKWRFLHSHNFSVAASVLKKLQGFNEHLRYWGADDIELGYRLSLEKLDFRYSHPAGGIHLYHPPSNVLHAYHKNLRQFYKEHTHNAVEFFMLEYLLTPGEVLHLFQNCRDSYNMKIPVTQGLPFRGEILTNNLDLAGTDCTPGVGLYLENITKKYDYYLLSGHLAETGMTVFFKILENGKDLCKKMAVYDPGGKAHKSLNEMVSLSAPFTLEKQDDFIFINWSAPLKTVICEFTQETFLDFFFKDFIRYPLMEAIRQQTLCYHMKKMEKLDPPDSFLSTKNFVAESYAQIKHAPVFMFHRPYELYAKARYKYPVSVYYDTVEFSYSDKKLMELDEKYDILFFFSPEILTRFKTVCRQSEGKAHYLPMALDLSLFKNKPEPFPQEKFRFLFIERYARLCSGIYDAVAVFRQEFKDETDIEFEIVLSPAKHFSYQNVYFDDNKNLNFTHWARQLERLSQRQIESDPLFADPRIHIQRLDLTKERLLKELYTNNAFIDLDWNMSVPVIASWSLLCGLQVITGDHKKSFFPLKTANLHYCQTQLSSGHLLDTELVVPLENDYLDRNSLREVYYPDREQLGRIMRGLYTDWKNDRQSKKFAPTANWESVFNAENIGQEVIKILRDYLDANWNY